jgi:hypothetical protein
VTGNSRERGDEAGSPILKIIGGNALTEDETRNVRLESFRDLARQGRYRHRFMNLGFMNLGLRPPSIQGAPVCLRQFAPPKSLFSNCPPVDHWPVASVGPLTGSRSVRLLLLVLLLTG